MNFKIEQMDRATIFRPNEKRLDSLVAPDLKAEFLILAQPDVETLVLDLSAVEYIDSAGLSALLLAQRQQVHHRGDMRIVGASKEVKSLLALTALDRVFPMYETVEQALAAPQLSLITIPPTDGDLGAGALRKGMKIAAGAMGALAIADLITSDGFLMDNGEEEVLDGDDDLEDDEDLEEDDFVDDDEEAIEPAKDEEAEESASDDELEETIDDDDIEEVDENDMLDAEDLDDLDEDKDEEEDDLF